MLLDLRTAQRGRQHPGQDRCEPEPTVQKTRPAQSVRSHGGESPHWPLACRPPGGRPWLGTGGRYGKNWSQSLLRVWD